MNIGLSLARSASAVAFGRSMALFAVLSAASGSSRGLEVNQGSVFPCVRIDGGITGSEGLILGPDGDLFAAEESGRGIIWRIIGRRAAPFVVLPHSFGPRAGMLLGLAVVGADLFVAAPKFQGGSIIRIPIRHPEKARAFVTHLGPIPNGLISDGRVLFVSETIFSRLYRLRLDRPEGARPAADETFPAPRSAPNGLALSPDGRTLFIVHTSPKISVFEMRKTEVRMGVLCRENFAGIA